MFKSTLVKWAVAAAMAVPAVPMFGKTIHHRFVSRSHTHVVTAVRPRTVHHLVARPHRLVTRSHHKVALATTHHRLASTHHLTTTSRHIVRKSTSHRVIPTTSSHFKVHVTKMPPTIDGINA
jgi:hypothetical protein